MARAAKKRSQVNECRRCATFCDRVIEPRTCLEANCPSLYVYDEPLSGRRFMGCVEKVFGTEIDVELFRAAERTKVGFGTVKLSGTPTSRCNFLVDEAYGHRSGPDFGCVNRRFADLPDQSHGAVRAFDLRDLT